MVELDFIPKVLMSLLSPLLARSGEALQQRIFKKKEGLADGGSPEQRFAAYETLRRACVDLRTALDVLWSLPVGFVGGLVSLSIIHRFLHRLPALTVAINDGFLGVSMVGRREVVEAAEGIASALQLVLKQHEVPSYGRSRRERIVTDWKDFDEALTRFVRASRSDLGIQLIEAR